MKQQPVSYVGGRRRRRRAKPRHGRCAITVVRVCCTLRLQSAWRPRRGARQAPSPHTKFHAALVTLTYSTLDVQVNRALKGPAATAGRQQDGSCAEQKAPGAASISTRKCALGKQSLRGEAVLGRVSAGAAKKRCALRPHAAAAATP